METSSDSDIEREAEREAELERLEEKLRRDKERNKRVCRKADEEEKRAAKLQKRLASYKKYIARKNAIDEKRVEVDGEYSNNVSRYNKAKKDITAWNEELKQLVCK